MIELTNIWKINNTLVVADSIEEAINIYKNHEGYSSINNVERVTDTFNGCAIINAPESLDLDRAYKRLKKVLIDNYTLDNIDIEEFIEMFKEAMENDN